MNLAKRNNYRCCWQTYVTWHTLC